MTIVLIKGVLIEAKGYFYMFIQDIINKGKPGTLFYSNHMNKNKKGGFKVKI